MTSKSGGTIYPECAKDYKLEKKEKFVCASVCIACLPKSNLPINLQYLPPFIQAIAPEMRPRRLVQSPTIESGHYPTMVHHLP